MTDQPEFGPQHIYALNRARNAVLKEARQFANDHSTFNDKGAMRSAASMLEENRACSQVAAYLANLVADLRARAERGPSENPE